MSLLACYRGLIRATRFRSLLLLLSGLCATAWADHGIAREYQVKAAYIYNVSKFFTWPDEPVNNGAEGPIHICVLGENPFRDYIRKLENFKAKGRSIDVHIYPGVTAAALGHCHLAFFAEQEIERARPFLSSEVPHPILTIGEGEDFVEAGGLVGLIVVDNTIQLEINLSKAKAQGFSISANLLEVARSVK